MSRTLLRVLGMNIQTERGVALLAALLLGLILFALGTAFSASALTEVSVVRNHQRYVEARAAAEAGLSHAVQLAVRRLDAWQATGFAGPGAAVTALLRGPDNAINAVADHPSNADNGSLAALELAGEIELPQFPAVAVVPAMPEASYRARIVDEDHPSRNLTATDRVRIGENGQAEADANKRAVLQVTGLAHDDTVVSLEAIIGRNGGPAIVTDQSLTINGNPSINGVNGSVHSNMNLTITGNPTISGDATATGIYGESGGPTILGERGGGRPLIPIPTVQASDYRSHADFVMTTGVGGGRLYGPFANPTTGALGMLLCDAAASNDACKAVWGWEYDPGNSGWKVSSNNMANGTFYVQGNATISGNPGNSGLPKVVSLIAEGNIEISGTPRFQPETPGVMLVTNRDLKLNGNFEMVAGIEGRILVGEQMMISGNPILFGQIYVDNAASVSNMVIDTAISGNPAITYDGGLGEGGFIVTGWREVR
jgi:hypothetical protein